MVRVKTQRDKHGGETLLLTHGGADGTATVVIYAHRTIPGLRLARHPFDEETIQLLERTYPELDFDWAKILRTAASSVAAGPPEAFVPQRPVRGRPAAADEGSGPNRRRGQDVGRAPQPRDARRSRPEPGVADGHAQSPDGELPETAVAIPDAEAPAGPAEPTPIGPVGLDTHVDHPAGLQGVEPLGAPATEPQASSVPEAEDDEGEDGPEEEDGPSEERAAGEGPRPTGGDATGTHAVGSVAERYAALVQRIQQRVRDPRRRAALLAQAAALEPSLWVEPLDHDVAARFEQLHAAIRRQLPSRRRRTRRRGPGGAAHGSPGQGDREARPEPSGE